METLTVMNVRTDLRHRILIEPALPTEATVALILVSNDAGHLLLFRQSQVDARNALRSQNAQAKDLQI